VFEDGETNVRLEEHVRGSDVYIIQSLCVPVDHHIMELLLIVDAVRRCSASRVTAVVPYLAYAKQEKKTAGLREPISAKLLANIMATAGVDRLLTVDLHSAAIEGFFDIPVDHLRIHGTLANYFDRMDLCEDVVVVSPDTGGVARANDLRERLGGSLAIIYRQGPNRRSGLTLEMVGDVKGKCAIVMDDMITTGSTLFSTAEALLDRGASRVYACATHAVFTDGVLKAIQESPIERVVVTNTVPLPGPAVEKLDVITVGPLIAESILRIHKDISLSSLFD
jgi:ribose-phosphate pyrophosphokinase